MTNMPVDILYETFSHLEPLDLLHLSRATKDLRALLLTKAALAVWQSVRVLFLEQAGGCIAVRAELCCQGRAKKMKF